MHFTWFSRRDGVFSHEFTVSRPEPRSGEGHKDLCDDALDTTVYNPPLLENHVKCIFSHATLCCQNIANNKT